MMSAKINSVFYRDPSEPIELATNKNSAPTFDGYRFHLSRNIQANLAMSTDEQDGSYYSLLIGMFVDGKECQYVTDWIRNDDESRAKDYAFEIPAYSKYMKPGKVHTIEFKLGRRKFVKNYMLYSGAPFDVAKREYDMFDSVTYYYKVGVLPE